MNLHQLRFVREAVRQNFSLTEAAKALFTSQPGVSKAIIELEEELGIDIFMRHGKRIRGLTEPGQAVLKSVELIMQEIDGLKQIGKEFAAQDSGGFTIATTLRNSTVLNKYPSKICNNDTWDELWRVVRYHARRNSSAAINRYFKSEWILIKLTFSTGISRIAQTQIRTNTLTMY